MQVEYISQKYCLDKYTSERAFKPSYTFSSPSDHDTNGEEDNDDDSTVDKVW